MISKKQTDILKCISNQFTKMSPKEYIHKVRIGCYKNKQTNLRIIQKYDSQKIINRLKSKI